MWKWDQYKQGQEIGDHLWKQYGETPAPANNTKLAWRGGGQFTVPATLEVGQENGVKPEELAVS